MSVIHVAYYSTAFGVAVLVGYFFPVGIAVLVCICGMAAMCLLTAILEVGDFYEDDWWNNSRGQTIKSVLALIANVVVVAFGCWIGATL